MNTQQLIHQAIKSIRNDIELFSSSASNGNAELCQYYSHVISGKVSLLLEMRLLNIDQWKTLDFIVSRALLKGCL